MNRILLFTVTFLISGFVQAQWKDLVGIHQSQLKTELFKWEIQIPSTEIIIDEEGHNILLVEDKADQYILYFEKNVVVGMFWITNSEESYQEVLKHCNKNYSREGRYLSPYKEDDRLKVLATPTKTNQCRLFLFQKLHRVSHIVEGVLGHWMLLEDPEAFGDDFIEEWNKRMEIPRGSEDDLIYPTEDNSIFYNCTTNPEDNLDCRSRGIIIWITQNFKYPSTASTSRIYVSFTLGTNGEVKNVKVERGGSAELDKEAVKVVEGIPMFIPAIKNGKRVPVTYIVPISIHLKR
ncbi:MAG: energy transducer TonB [Bacteroidota bacterium]